MREMASLVVVERAGSAGVDAGRSGCSFDVDAVAVVEANRAYEEAAIRLGPVRVVETVPRNREAAEKRVRAAQEEITPSLPDCHMLSAERDAMMVSTVIRGVARTMVVRRLRVDLRQ